MLKINYTTCLSLLLSFLLSLKMNEASILTLQKEIAELEQLYIFANEVFYG